MKHAILWFLVISVLLSGCSIEGSDSDDTLTFYYLENTYTYGADGAVMDSELRDASGHRRDLSYLMALYLMGPTEEDHTMPLPPGTRIYGTVLEDGNITLQLSEAAINMSDAELSLASACLSLTCFGFSDAESVCVQAGERSVTMTRDSMTLYDRSEKHPIMEETQ